MTWRFPRHCGVGYWSMNSAFPGSGLPPWQIMRGPQIAELTLGAKLSAVERLYAHAADVSGINLDRAIAALDLEAIKDVMGGFFLALTNHHAAIGEDISQSWMAALDFVGFLARQLAPGKTGGAGQHRERSCRAGCSPL